MSGIRKIIKEFKVMHGVFGFVIALNLGIQLLVNHFVGSFPDGQVYSFLIIFTLIAVGVFAGVSGMLLSTIHFRMALLFNRNRREIIKESLIYLAVLAALGSLLIVSIVTICAGQANYALPLTFGLNWNIPGACFQKWGLGFLLLYGIGMALCFSVSAFMRHGLLTGLTHCFILGTLVVLAVPTLNNFCYWGSQGTYSLLILLLGNVFGSQMIYKNLMQTEIE